MKSIFLAMMLIAFSRIAGAHPPGGPPMPPQQSIDLQSGQQTLIDWQTLQQYGGRVVVSCDNWNPGGGWPPGGGGGQVTIPLGGNSCGNGTGACACVTPGAPYQPNPQAAAQICTELGYRRMITFQTAQGYRGQYQCSGVYSGSCFVNQNPGNITCSSVTCAR